MPGHRQGSTGVPGHELGVLVARWSVIGTGALVIMAAVLRLPVSGMPSSMVWGQLSVGAGVQLLAFAGAVLATSEIRGAVSSRLCLIAAVLPLLTTMFVAAARSGMVTAPSWLPTGQTAGVHLLLGLALIATFRRSRLLAVVRVVGWVTALLTSAMAIIAHAFGGLGYSFLPGVGPMSGITAAATFVVAMGIAAIAPHRWPLRDLIRASSDEVLVRHLLPLLLVIPVLSPVVFAVASSTGLDEQITIALGPSVTLLALVGFLTVVLRDHRRLVAEISSRDAQLQSILDELPVGVMLRSSDGRLLQLNPGAERFVARMGVDVAVVRDSPRGLLAHIRVVDEDGQPCDPEKLPVVAAVRDGTSHESTLGFEQPDGATAWYRVRAAPVPLVDGTRGTVMTLDDVSEQHASRQRLALAERSLRSTFDHAPIGIAVLDPEGELLQVNRALCELLGANEDDLLATGLQDVAHPDERAESRHLWLDWVAGEAQSHMVDRRFRHASGRWVPTQMSVAVIRDDDGTPVRLIAQVVDLTEHRALERELREAAVHDALTGLPNRRALTERLLEAQHRQARAGGDIGLLFLDLDDFKAVNDVHGHDVGDQVLIETGRRLLAATRETDAVCRIGGDEFVVLCAPIDGSRGLQEIVERLMAMDPPTVIVGRHEVRARPSIGAVLIATDDDLDDGLRRADAAMYQAKRRNRGSSPSETPRTATV
jgi:diguanylate cyclase (GGDEF)-like protein/PAS domain S-box-containing protein